MVQDNDTFFLDILRHLYRPLHLRKDINKPYLFQGLIRVIHV